jgi:hypothetical protein
VPGAMAPSCAASILVGTNEEPKLGKGPFSTYTDNLTLLGLVSVPVGLASASISVNGSAPAALTVDAAGNFSQSLALLSNATQASVTNVIEITAVDILGTSTTLTFNIEVLSVAVRDEIVVVFNPDTSQTVRQQTLQAVGASLKRQLAPHIWLANTPGGTAAQVIQTLNPPSTNVRAAFPNLILKLSLVPNDTLIATQKEYLQAIRAFDAWDTETGSRDVLVAVVDSGVNLPSLVRLGGCSGATAASNVFLNEAECCTQPPCSADERLNCMPGALNNPHSPSGLNGFGDCPRKDQNGDGCPGVCGVDDDNDGFADMDDPEVKRLYSNGVDDDGDGLVDEQAIVNGVTVPCSSVKPGDLKNAPSNGDCDGAANDDDEDGYPDDCRGWNFGRFILPECTAAQEADAGNGTCIYKGSIDHPNQTLDTRGFGRPGYTHGEWVARSIGEPGNDCSAYTGLAFKVTILPLVASRYFPPQGGEPGTINADVATAIEAYQYAAAKGAHIINSSFVGGTDAAFAAQFPQLANSYGIQLVTDIMDLTGTGSALHVIAAGNNMSDVSQWVTFPSQANIPNKLVVGASDPADDSVLSFSNYSATLLDISAPGTRLMQGFGGTSGAAPLVSGAAALLMSHFPTLRGQPELVAQMIRASARLASVWSGKNKTGGVLDIAAALGQSVPSLLFRDVSATSVKNPGNLPNTEVELVDADFDGHVDYVFESQCSRTSNEAQPHLLVNQSGVLSDQTATLLPSFKGSFCQVASGDLDGDGHSDIVLAAFLPDGSASQLQNRALMGGATGFSLSDRFGADAQLTRGVALCDVDSDGDLDVYFANVQKSTSVLATDQLLQNDGAGNFTDISSQALGFAESSQSPHKVLCVDVDPPPANRCQGLPNDTCTLCADPRLSIPGLVSAGRVTSDDRATCLAVRALVKPEIIVAGAEGASTKLLRRDSTGVFRDKSCDLNLPYADGTPLSNCVVGVNVPGRQDQDVEVADFDGDGDMDLILVSRRGRPNTLLFNNGNGVFTNVTATKWNMLVDDTRDVEVTDVNNDGKPDAIIFRGDPNLMNPGQNTLYLNDGTGKLTEYVASGLGAKVDLTTAARIADLDGDGDQDLVLVRFGKSDKVFFNNTIP